MTEARFAVVPPGRAIPWGRVPPGAVHDAVADFENTEPPSTGDRGASSWLWRVDRLSFWIAALTALAGLEFGLLEAVLVGVVIAALPRPSLEMAHRLPVWEQWDRAGRLHPTPMAAVRAYRGAD